MQNSPGDAVHVQAAYLRRQALSEAARRLRGRPAVPEEQRVAVLDAVVEAHAERADEFDST